MNYCFHCDVRWQIKSIFCQILIKTIIADNYMYRLHVFSTSHSFSEISSVFVFNYRGLIARRIYLQACVLYEISFRIKQVSYFYYKKFFIYCRLISYRIIFRNVTKTRYIDISFLLNCKTLSTYSKMNMLFVLWQQSHHIVSVVLKVILS